MLDLNECEAGLGDFCNGYECINLKPGFRCNCPGFSDDRCKLGNFNI